MKDGGLGGGALFFFPQALQVAIMVHPLKLIIPIYEIAADYY